ncbi:hypothetical protein [Flavihumibacter sp. CACIAM 22H1]|uniref:hypothetical protein n=1 Tax=Flavihumibacter sp. CACIAM 22H1 TaxID=1812911 RepID=UPI0007A81D61|nr:hypothetical protein [Flavihumibacter sp. CACIAM 22H1]KYP16604.1 MAG: hypothetical protein A1D16_09320 [Flavihumibacter sp. CACIAM 22H1]
MVSSTPVTKSGRQPVHPLYNKELNDFRYLLSDLHCNLINSWKDSIQVFYSKGTDSIVETIWISANTTGFEHRVEVHWKKEPVKLDYVLSGFEMNVSGMPDFIHTPGVKFYDPRSGLAEKQVFGDRSFAAPAIIYQEKTDFIALVPDLNLINQFQVRTMDARKDYFYSTNGPFNIPMKEYLRTMPTALDYTTDAGFTSKPVMSFGLMDTKIGFHTRYIRDEADPALIKTVLANRAVYGFTLLLSAQAAPMSYSIVAEMQWQKFGRSNFYDSSGLSMPFIEYVKSTTSAIFNPVKTADNKPVEISGGILDIPVPGYKDQGSWLEWTENGEQRGGFRCSAPFWNDVINNSPYWNQARDAIGLYYWGKETGNDTLLTAAGKIINWCLSAPRNSYGLFHTVYSAKDKKWGVGWTDPPNGKSVLFLRDAASYEIPALSKTAAHLTDFYLRAQQDERILNYLEPYANWLVSAVEDDGNLPSFVSLSMEPSPLLKESAHAAASMWFLALYGRATGKNDYILAARKIGDYLSKEIIPSAKWIDAEQYNSCGAKPFTYIKDSLQKQWYRGSLVTIWALNAYVALHQATMDQECLYWAAKCADYLSFTQCVWKPHFVFTANVFGGMGTDNSDNSVFLDQRQAELAQPFIYLGKTTGRADYIERGVAAGKAGVKLIVQPSHQKNDIFPYPKFYPVGMAPENIDHEATPQCPMRTHPLWGEASAVYTGLSEIYRSLGSLYIDRERNWIIPTEEVRFKIPANRKNKHILVVSNGLELPYLSYPWQMKRSISIREKLTKKETVQKIQFDTENKTVQVKL